jgi:hypothetical protein
LLVIGERSYDRYRVNGIAAADVDGGSLPDDSGAIPLIIQTGRTSAIGSATEVAPAPDLGIGEEQGSTKRGRDTRIIGIAVLTATIGVRPRSGQGACGRDATLSVRELRWCLPWR